MKKTIKYLSLFGLLALIPTVASAEITVKDTVSPEFIHNAGYSSEVSRIIEVKTRDYATPIPVENKKDKVNKFRWYLWQTADPAVDRPNSFVNHDIKYHNSISDL